MDYLITTTFSTTPVTCVGYECITEGQVAAILAINIVISLVGIAGNSLVIFSVVRTRSLQNHNNVFLASLAVADFMMSAIGIPIHAVVGYGFITRVDSWLCLSIAVFLEGMALVTLLHITVIAFDRYLAVTSPLTYNQKMTNTLVAILISGVWLASALLSFIPFVWNNIAEQDKFKCNILFVQASGYLVMVTILFVVMPFFMISYWYFHIFRIARGHRRQIRAIEIALETNNNASGDNSSTIARIKADLRGAFTLIIIMGFFVLAWSPGSSLIMIDIFIPISKTGTTYKYVLMVITNIFFSSAINPIIYAARNKEFRKAFGDQMKWVLGGCTREFL